MDGLERNRGTAALIGFAFVFLAAAPLRAVWPLPPYASYPDCSGTTPSQNCSQQPGSIEIHRQIKLSDRSVQFPATDSCTPISGQFGGFCDGPGCTSEAGFCRQPAILGTPGYDVITTSSGTYVRFHVEYDFPGNYCQLSPDGDVAEWPIVFNDDHLDRLQVIEAGSGNIVAESMAVFEHGQWNPLVAFCGKGSYLLRVLSKCAGLNQTVAISIDAATQPGISLTPCAGDRNCFFCWLANGGPSVPQGVGKPINVGSGDVGLQIALFTIAQSPLALSMTLTYHSQIAGNPRLLHEPVGSGWTHTFNESLRRVDNFTNELYRLRADGSEAWYRPAGNGAWVSQTPGDLRESVTLAGSQLQIKDLNGTTTAFDASTGNWISTTDRWGNQIAGTYASGALTTITDAEGRQVVLGYSGGQLTQITLPDGSAWRFAYSAGELTQVFDPMHTGSTPWRTLEYQPDTRGTARLLTAMRDESGALLEGHAYDALERGISSFSGASREMVTVQYDGPIPSKTVVTSAIDSSTAQTATFMLIAQRGRFLPLEIIGNCASCGSGDDDEKFSFDGSNFPISKTDGDGNLTTYAYDSNGNIVRRIDAAGTPAQRTVTFSYSDAAWPSFMTQMSETSVARPGATRVTTRTWNSDETALTTTQSGWQRISDTAPTVYTTVESFDARHRSLSVDGPRTDVTDVTTRTWFSDSDLNGNRRGRLQSMRDAAGLTTAFDDYDIYGTARTMTDPNGVRTLQQTDARGRIVASTNKTVPGDPRENTDYTSTMSYDGRDRLTRRTMPRGNAIRFAYEDGTNWLSDTIRLDANGNELERRHVTLNLIGDKAREEDQECASPSPGCISWVTRHQEDFAYDVHNRLAQIVHPVPSGSSVRYRYDAAGLLASVQDENHGTANTIYSYDAQHRLTSVRQILNGSTINTSYGYDAQDNLISVTDPNGNTTTYAYDDFHRMQSQTSPVTGPTSYSYDAAGNLTSSVDANGATTDRSWDAANRLRTAVSSRGGAATESIGYTYDDAGAGNYGKGRLAVVSDPAGSIAYAYDRRGFLRSEAHSIEGNSYSMSYAYDANGNRTSMTYPSGRVVQYAFDFADRPQSAASGGTTIVGSTSYLPFGPEARLSFGNATTKTSAYDLRYRPVQSTLAGAAGAIADWSYSEDPAGNITAIHDLLDPSYNRDFAYDDLNRLIAATGGSSLWGAGAYRYDLMGNMLSLSLGAARQSEFTYSGSLPNLTAVNDNGSSRAVSYDAAGNEVGVGAGTFGYSPRNLLASADGLTYSYDGRNVRTITTVANALGTFSGNVAASAGGAPIAGAIVSVDGTLNSTTTDNAGNFAINQPAGNFTLTVIKPGFLPETTTAFTLNAGANVAVGSIKLSVAPSTITGTVVSSFGGNVAGATIAFSGGATASSDANGHFSITQPAGTFTAAISAGGYTPQTTASFTTKPGQTYSLGTVTLTAIPASVTGTVISSTGGPVAGATVIASGGSSGAARGGRVAPLANGSTTTTDGSGNFTFSLAAGTYMLTISRDGFGALSTSRFTVGPGSAFSFGSVAIDPLGTISGSVLAQTTGAPVANATVAISGSVNTISTDGSGRFSIQQPAGLYSIHVSAAGFADANTSFFTLAPGATFDAGPIQLPAVALQVFVGYADDLRSSSNFPVPWAGTPNTIYLGTGSPVDAGAIRLDNATDLPMAIDNVTVDLGRPGPSFSLWGSFAVPAHGSVILTQTALFNFDTSDDPIVACGQTPIAGDPRVPRVIIKSNGTSTTYFDTAHVLDTGGFDLACRGNESLQWRLIGTTGINSKGDFLLGPPTGTNPLGQPYTLTASVTDGTGQPVSGVTVNFKVIQGPNNGTTGSAATNASGVASFTYTSHTAGTDTLQATIPNASGGTSTSNPVTVTWPAFSNVDVFVGYADDLRPGPAFPNPWQGSPGVVFIGNRGGDWDSGAVRIDNTSDAPLPIDRVSVDLQRPGPTFSLWGSFTIPAHGTAILAQTNGENFDTSDHAIVGCGQQIPANDKRIPKITITIAGQSASYLDTAHILDTFGYDVGNCPPANSNESLQWRPVGSSSTAAAGSLALRPISAVSVAGASDTAIAVATDAAGEPVANLPVDFRVMSGPNAGKSGRVSTDASGIAAFTYTSSLTGVDTLRASITNSSGGVVTSNDVTSTWISTVVLALSPPSATITINNPFNATVLATDGGGVPLPNVFVTFRITGGPNSGKSGSGVTDATGRALFAYFSAVLGSDTLVASVVGANGSSVLSNVVSAIWTAPVAISLAPSSASNPLGSNDTATAFVSSGNVPSPSSPVTFNVVAGPNAGKSHPATTDGTGHAAFVFTSDGLGTDVVQASTGSVQSNQIVAKWISIPTIVSYTGAPSGESNDPLILSAHLIDAVASVPIAGQTVAFTFAGQTLTATTDANGNASATVTPPAPGAVPLSVSFAAAGSYSASSASLTINVVRDESAIRYTGKAVVADGTSQTLTALLTDPDGARPLGGRTISFNIASLVATAVTDADGIASIPMNIPLSTGTGPIRADVSFAGDPTTVGANASVPLILYQPQSFVIWGGNAVPPKVGDRVNFWGSQWAAQVTSGDFDRTADFKGWAVPSGSPLVPCGPQCWTSKPGESNPPPALERYISVLVATSIRQANGLVAGNIAATVVVRVDPSPAYANVPGKPGYGVIVGVIEDAAHLFSTSTMKAMLHSGPASVASGTRRYSLYTPELNLMAETSMTSANRPPIAYEYVWFNGHPVAQFDAATSTAHWTFTDHLGTPTVLTNADGSVYWRAEYEPYGSVFALRSADAHQPLRLPGQEAEQLDAGANGLTERSYNIFRWYREGWGRYTQADPFELAGGTNLFRYSEDDPVRFTDRLGLDTVGCDMYGLGRLRAETRCELQCCAKHDQCYDLNHCSKGSWPEQKPQCGCDQTAGCRKCNADAAFCIASCLSSGDAGTQSDPLFYCGAWHRYVRIPSDFANRAAAERTCEHDYTRDCKLPLTTPRPRPWFLRIFLP